jgi:ectoine hydroxylase-related dioxygenase (phytanoyl-CoA dioxygenase family)
MKTPCSTPVPYCVGLVGLLLPFLLPFSEVLYQSTAAHDVGHSVATSSTLVNVQASDTAEIQSLFEEQGYAILRSVVPPALAASLLVEAESVFRRRRVAGELPTVPVNAMYSAWLESSVLRQFWATSNISAVVAHATKASTLRLLDDAVFVTEPDRMAYDCWHSDWYSFGSVTKATHHSAHSLWIALVDVPAETRGGSIQLCGRRDMPANCTGVDFDAEAKEAGRVGLGGSWCEQHMSASCPIPEFRAGDAVVFAADMLHRTQSLRDPSFERYALIGRFVAEGARYQRRQTSFLNHETYKVKHDMCKHGLRPGDPILGPCFPRIFPDVDPGELDSDRRYISRWVARGMGHAERLWFGGILPD